MVEWRVCEVLPWGVWAVGTHVVVWCWVVGMRSRCQNILEVVAVEVLGTCRMALWAPALARTLEAAVVEGLGM